jgi:predicted MPP superfamily phosphohydrolase
MQNLLLAILVYAFIQSGSIFSCSREKGAEQEATPLQFSFGVIADCQYSNKEDNRSRKYSLSRQKLIEAIRHFNEMDLEFVVQLGDLIDQDIVSYDTVLPILKNLNVHYYHVLGNHDFSVFDMQKDSVLIKLNLRSRYYDFAAKDYRFIVLDGNDVSFHAYPEDTEAYKDAVNYYQKNEIISPKWNGAIGIKQLTWLRSVLAKANQNNENVILLCHFPVYPENEHNLWNAAEILNLIESYSCVKVYLSGHNHQGNYGRKGRTHYLTLQGMVETEQTSYTRIQVYADSIKVIGFGREQNRTLKFNMD